MNTNQLIASLAVDLKRIANAYHDNSINTGNRFVQEVLESKSKIKDNETTLYMRKVLKKLTTVLMNKNYEELAEDALMYSMILQNYYISRLN